MISSFIHSFMISLHVNNLKTLQYDLASRQSHMQSNQQGQVQISFSAFLLITSSQFNHIMLLLTYTPTLELEHFNITVHQPESDNKSKLLLFRCVNAT